VDTVSRKKYYRRNRDAIGNSLAGLEMLAEGWTSWLGIFGGWCLGAESKIGGKVLKAANVSQDIFIHWTIHLA